MKVKFGLGRHPARRELLDFAEGRVDGRSTLQARMAAHVAKCGKCGKEVNTITDSLDFIAEAKPLEPSAELTSSILMRARQEREAMASRPRRISFRMPVRGLVYAGAMAAVALTVVSVLYTHPELKSETTMAANPPVAQEALTVDPIEDAAREIEVLSAAMQDTEERPVSLREQLHRRAVNRYNSDITAAMAALERNPGCERASRIMRTGLERQAEALRKLYVDRGL